MMFGDIIFNLSYKKTSMSVDNNELDDVILYNNNKILMVIIFS